MLAGPPLTHWATLMGGAGIVTANRDGAKAGEAAKAGIARVNRVNSTAMGRNRDIALPPVSIDLNSSPGVLHRHPIGQVGIALSACPHYGDPTPAGLSPRRGVRLPSRVGYPQR